MFKNITIILSIFILPSLMIFLIYFQIKEIYKTKFDYNLNVGKIESVGITENLHKGSFKSPTTESKVFYIKLQSNNTLYSFFKRKTDYNELYNKIKIGDFVKVYNQGYDSKQNTVDIIQLETSNQVIIDKSEFDFKNKFILYLFLIFLFLYFFIPYKFIYLKSKKYTIQNPVSKL